MQSQVDAALAAASAKISKGGSVAAVMGWVISSELAAMCGVVIAFLGLLMNFYYRHRQEKRDRERELREIAEHQERMEGFRMTKGRG